MIANETKGAANQVAAVAFTHLLRALFDLVTYFPTMFCFRFQVLKGGNKHISSNFIHVTKSQQLYQINVAFQQKNNC